MNTAEGSEEGLVDLNSDHYEGTGITYLGFPLWDAPGCNIIPYLGIAADYICSAIDQSGMYSYYLTVVAALNLKVYFIQN